MRFQSMVIAAALLFSTAASALAGHVQAELLSDVSGVQAGTPFWLGVRLTMDSGWHVYWKNPGDAGLPTRVKWTLPPGFQAGPLQFPAPSHFVMPGKIIIFGYENTVVLLSRITPPANLPADFHGDFKAAVDWLVCSEVCIPGKAEVAVKLNASEAASPVYADLFDRWIAQIPVEPAKSPDVAGVEVGAKSGVITVTWKHAAPTEADFFPETPDVYNITNIQVKAQDNQTVIRFSAEALAGKRPGPMTMQAVLGYQDNGGKRRGLIIPVALPGQSSQN